MRPVHREAGGAGDPRGPGQLGSAGRPLCVCVCVSAQAATGGERIQCQQLGRLSVYGQLPGSTLYSYTFLPAPQIDFHPDQAEKGTRQGCWCCMCLREC